MSVITLTTEYMTKGYEVASVKGAVIRALDRPEIVDITHEIEPFAYMEAAFVVRSVFEGFPEGSIHLIGVDCIKKIEDKYLVVKYKKHYFIGHDNGFFSVLLQGDTAEDIREIGWDYRGTFPMIDVFVPVAVRLYSGQSIDVISRPVEEVKKITLRLVPGVKENELSGRVIHIDSYGNVVTSITREQFEQKRQGRKFVIEVRAFTINRISEQYAYHESGYALRDGDMLALFNSLGLLEIAIYKGRPGLEGGATSLLGLSLEDTIKIVFE